MLIGKFAKDSIFTPPPLAVVPSSAASSSFPAHSGSVSCARFSSREGIFASGSTSDRKVNLWSMKDSEQPTQVVSLSGHSSGVEGLAFSPEGENLVSGCLGGSVRIWDLEISKCIAALAGHRSPCKKVEYHPFGNFFATGATDGSIKVWDVRQKRCVQSYKGPGNLLEISSLKFSPHGRWLASGIGDSVKLWDLSAGKVLTEFVSDSLQEVRSIAFHPVDFYLVAAYERGNAIWSCEDFSLVSKFEGHHDFLKFSGNGQFLLAAGSAGLGEAKWDKPKCSIRSIFTGCSLANIFDIKIDNQNTPFGIKDGGDGILQIWKLKEDRRKNAKIAVQSKVEKPDNYVVEKNFKEERKAEKVPPSSEDTAASDEKNLQSPDFFLEKSERMRFKRPPKPLDRSEIPIEPMIRPAVISPRKEIVKAVVSCPENREPVSSGRLLRLSADFRKFLIKRSQAHQKVASLWSNGQTLHAVNEAAKDVAVFDQFLISLPLDRHPHPLTLDLCRAILALLNKLVHNDNIDGYIGIFNATELLVTRFGEVIRETRKTNASVGVDLQRGLRLDKCNECVESFKRIYDWMSSHAPNSKITYLRTFLDNC